MEECGGVIIRFPEEGSTKDRVIIRGPKDDVESAKKQLLELADQIVSCIITIKIRKIQIQESFGYKNKLV